MTTTRARRVRATVVPLVMAVLFGTLQAMPAEAAPTPTPVPDRAVPVASAPAAAAPVAVAAPHAPGPARSGPAAVAVGSAGTQRAALATATGPAGYDYATSAFGDPWDNSNQEDLTLNFSGTQKFSGLTMSGGVVSGRTLANSAYLSPVWAGYATSLLNGRDGALTRNTIDADRYNAMVIQMWSNADVAADANFYGVWFRCPGINPDNACAGRTPLTYLHRGWNTYVIPLGETARGFSLDWKGRFNGLRLVFNAGRADIKIDWMRLTRLDTAQKVAVRTSSNVDLVWDRNTSNSDNLTYPTSADPSPGTSSSNWGYVRAGSPGRSSVLAGNRADLSFLPAGTYRIGTRPKAGGAITWARQVTLVAPRPRLIAPNETGATDFATAVRKNPWDMASSADVSSRTNATTSFTSGTLNGRNAGPTFNDPRITVPIGSGVPGSQYNILSVTTSSPGKFNLSGKPGGGSVVRFVWRRSDHDTSAQTVTSRPIPTYPGTRTYTIDLSRPDAEIIDSPVSRPSWSFTGSAPVSQVRWDPNEDPANGSGGVAPRQWKITNVQLRMHFSADGSFAITWTDDVYRPGGRATVVIGRTANSCTGTAIASDVLVKPGTNTTIWNTRATAPGQLWICVKIKRSGSTTAAVARSSVRVAHSSARPAAPLRPTVVTTKRNGGRIDVTFRPGSGRITGYQVEDAVNRSFIALSAGTRSTYIVCPTAAKHVRVRVRSFGPGGVSAWTALGLDHRAC